MLFRLYNAPTAGTQTGPTLCVDNVQATNGLITVTLDFGPVYDSNARWLQIAVRADTTVGNCVLGTFTTLSPRQPLTAAPYTSGLAFPITEHADSAGPLLTISNDSGAAIRVESLATNEAAIHAVHTTPNTTAYGVWGQSASTTGRGVFGWATAPTGGTWGVAGVSDSSSGLGVFGDVTATSGTNYAVFGQTASPTGYGGYFIGRGYFSDFVGIGTTTPVVPLQVVGGSDATLTGGGNLVVGQTSGNNVVLDNNEIMARSNGVASNLYLNALGGEVGIGTNSPSATLSVNGAANKPGGGSWSTFSDARLKKNIQPITGALDTMLQLRGVTFEYIDPRSINELPGTRTGMVAQEVEKVMPDWVDQGPDGMKRVTYRGFEALTVEAFRDQQRQLEALRSGNAALREQLASLASDLAALKSQVGSRGPTR